MPEFRWYHGNSFRPEAKRLQGGFLSERGDTVFRFQFEYNFEDLLALNRVAAKIAKPYKKIIIGLFFTIAFCAGLFFTLGGVLLLRRDHDIAKVIPPLVIGVIYLTLVLFRQRLNALYSKRLLLKGTGELTVVLDGDGVSEHSAKGEAQYPWAAFVGGYLCRERYLLFLDKRHAAVLPKRALVEGDFAELNGFLAEKLGKEIREIR